MENKQIKETDLHCSTLCLGGVALGSKLNRDESFRLMDLYADRGGNFIDTAQVYANWLPIESSISEKTIGLWMKTRKNRGEMLVTTKGAHPLLASMSQSRMSAEEVTKDVENSLRHLQVETIDLFLLHRDDINRPVAEIFEILNNLKKAGKLRYFGCSNWTTPRMEEAHHYAKAQGFQGFVGNQMMWSLAEVDKTKFADPTIVPMDGEMKQFHLDTGLTALPYSSQAQGLFTKWDSSVYSLEDERISAIYQSNVNRGRFKRVRELASELSSSVTAVVLSYLISQPFATFPIIGCHTAAQLIESLEAADLRLNWSQLACLEGIDID